MIEDPTLIVLFLFWLLSNPLWMNEICISARRRLRCCFFLKSGKRYGIRCHRTMLRGSSEVPERLQPLYRRERRGHIPHQMANHTTIPMYIQKIRIYICIIYIYIFRDEWIRRGCEASDVEARGCWASFAASLPAPLLPSPPPELCTYMFLFWLHITICRNTGGMISVIHPSHPLTTLTNPLRFSSLPSIPPAFVTFKSNWLRCNWFVLPILLSALLTPLVFNSPSCRTLHRNRFMFFSPHYLDFHNFQRIFRSCLL